MSEDREWDVFISHAWEDKEHLVRPLAFALSDLGASVWYDEFALRPGDSISASIDLGLVRSSAGLVILSPNFISKPWPKRELAGLTTLALAGQGRIIPVWHNIDHDQVTKFSAPLADVMAIRTVGLSAADLAIQLLRLVRPDLYAAQPRDQILRRANGQAFAELQEELDAAQEHLAEFQCPHCASDLAARIPAPVDPEEKHWDEIVCYECGYEEFAGEIRRLCPADPRFPAFTDYRMEIEQTEEGQWVCFAKPMTRMAEKVSVRPGTGSTKNDALADAKRNYQAIAPGRL